MTSDTRAGPPLSNKEEPKVAGTGRDSNHFEVCALDASAAVSSTSNKEKLDKSENNAKDEEKEHHHIVADDVSIKGRDNSKLSAEDERGEEYNRKKTIKHHAQNVKIKCSHGNCTNIAHVGGECNRHRYKYNDAEYKAKARGKARIARVQKNWDNMSPSEREEHLQKEEPQSEGRQCSDEGCTNIITRGKAIYCNLHRWKLNARKKCKFFNCTNISQGRKYCNKHATKEYPRKLCNYKGCTNLVLGKSFCTTHGKRKICNHEGCTNQARKRGVCVRHGAKKANCSVDGCTRYVVQGGVCVRHGAPSVKRCRVKKCETKAVMGGIVCVRHGIEVKKPQSMEGLEMDRDIEQDDVEGNDHGNNKSSGYFDEEPNNGADNIMDQYVDGVDSHTLPPTWQQLEPTLASLMAEPQNDEQLCPLTNNPILSPSPPPPPTETKSRKRIRKYYDRPPCNHPGCTNKSQVAGLCRRHGKSHSICKQEGCTNLARRGGVCTRHGARGKHCKVEGCTNYVQRGGVCVRHGSKNITLPAAAGKWKVVEDHNSKNVEEKQFLSEGSNDDRVAISQNDTTEFISDEIFDDESKKNETSMEMHGDNEHDTIDPATIASLLGDTNGELRQLTNNPIIASSTTPVVENNSLHSQKRRLRNTYHRKPCAHEGCTNQSQVGGLCRKHGKKSKTCCHEGCTNLARAGGICLRHGAKVKLCRMEGCDTIAVRDEVCTKHGSRRRKKKTQNEVEQEAYCQVVEVGGSEFSQPVNSKVDQLIAELELEENEQHEDCFDEVSKRADDITEQDVNIDNDIIDPATWQHEPTIGSLIGVVNSESRQPANKNHIESSSSAHPTEIDPGNPLPRRKCYPRKLCSHEGCSNPSRVGGLCYRHGKKSITTCSHKGCTNLARAGGICVRHGAAKTKSCRIKGCEIIAKKGGVCYTVMCNIHGAKRQHNLWRNSQNEEDLEQLSPQVEVASSESSPSANNNEVAQNIAKPVLNMAEQGGDDQKNKSWENYDEGSNNKNDTIMEQDGYDAMTPAPWQYV